MNKKELIEELSRKIGLPPKKATQFVNIFFDEIAINLIEGIEVELPGFGRFFPDGSFTSLWRDYDKDISISCVCRSDKTRSRYTWAKSGNPCYLPPSWYGTKVSKKG